MDLAKTGRKDRQEGGVSHGRRNQSGHNLADVRGQIKRILHGAPVLDLLTLAKKLLQEVNRQVRRLPPARNAAAKKMRKPTVHRTLSTRGTRKRSAKVRQAKQ
jgi:hypothetical protein